MTCDRPPVVALGFEPRAELPELLERLLAVGPAAERRQVDLGGLDRGGVGGDRPEFLGRLGEELR